MTERSIIFSRPMVRAILDGRKTQTRRVVKLPPAPHLGSWEPSTFGGPGLYLDKHCAKPANLPEQACISHTRTGRSLACPYGSPGDRLWVRETWARDEEDQEIFFYRASDHESCGQPWRPPIFMPRRAARITLEITEVRVQRVQEISPQDAKAEGIESRVYLEAPEYKLYGKELERLNQWTRDPRWSYEKLWDSINAKRGFSWASNPFVWAITFRYLRSSASIGGEFLEDVKAARA